MNLELLQNALVAHEWLSLREVLRLLLLSSLLSVWCCVAFPKNATSRRVLLLMAIVSMAFLPWLLHSVNLRWQLSVEILPSIDLGLGIPNLLVYTWLIVAFFLIVRHLHRVHSELKRICALPVESDPALREEIKALRNALVPNYPNLQLPEVRLGAQACATTLQGPVLVLPCNWTTFSADTRRSILAHELTHIARGDDRWLLLLRMLLLCYWWMPWLRKLQLVYIQSMEESCDDVASELIGARHTYAHALYEVALNNSSIHASDQQKQYLVHMRGHHLLTRVARFGDRRQLELDTAGVFWTLILITLSVTWVSGVQPVLASNSGSGFDSSLVYQLPTPQLTRPFVYPLVLERPASTQEGASRAWRLHNPIELTSAVYPGNALAAGQEYEVTISFAVAGDGTVVQPRALQQDNNGFAQSALRAVSASRYQPLYKMTEIQSNTVANRRAFDARSWTVPPHVNTVRYERKFYFRIERRQ